MAVHADQAALIEGHVMIAGPDDGRQREREHEGDDEDICSSKALPLHLIFPFFSDGRSTACHGGIV